MNVETILQDFFTDPRTLAIFALILADVLLGIAAALKTAQFQWTVLANFYRTNIMPYVLGYLVAWLFAKFGLATILSQSGVEISTAVFSVPVDVTLVASSGKSMQALGVLGPKRETPL
jgi:hypothetical protein